VIPSARRCAVIGGGMLGMELALDLAQAGWSVTLYERASELGGLAAPWELGDVRWDRHYHVVLPGDTRLLRRLESLGVRGEMRWAKARSAFYVNGEVRPFTTALDFLRFPSVPWADKARLGTTILRALSTADEEDLDSVSIEAWLRKHSGDRVFEHIWRPLLRAKLGDSYGDVSATFIRATIRRLYGGKRANDEHGRFGWVDGGYDRIIDRFERVLERNGVQIRKGTPVERVMPDAITGTVAVRSSYGNETFDEVALTIPPPLAVELCPSLPEAQASAWSSIRYRGVVCASMLLDRALGDAYVTNLGDDGLPFTGVIEMTALVDRATFNGNHLVYLPRYVDAADPYRSLPDGELFERFSAGLSRMYRSFDPASVRAFRVSRAPWVFAVPVVGYAHGVPGFDTGIPNVYLATSAQIVDGTLNVNETLELASRAAAHIRANADRSIADWHRGAA
jgi:protoporphyrinogen oxidase